MLELYTMNSEKEKRLWEQAIFIFDSSALLDLYYFPKKNRSTLYNKVFKKLDNRLWIPAHVEFEYKKNREKVIKKPITEKYIPLEDDIKYLIKRVREIESKINSIIDMTKNSDRHPHLEQSKIKLYKVLTENFFKGTETFQKDFQNQINAAKDEVISIEQNDDVLDAIKKYFQIGEEFPFDKILDITKEGKHRYEYKIPPGYGDFEKGEKKGTQIFGDLIIWKQILEYSKQKSMPVIFITNDIAKNEDWCYIDKNKKIISPREELIKEIYDTSKVEFWIYTQTDFFYKSIKYLQSTIEENKNPLKQMIEIAQVCHLIWLEMNKDTSSKEVSSINEDFITPIYNKIQTTQDQLKGYDTIELSGIAYFFKDILQNDSETVVFENTMAYSLRGLDAVTVDKNGIYTIYEIKGTTKSLKKPMRYLTKTKRRGRQLSLQWCWYSLTDCFDKPETANIFLTLYDDFLNGKIKRKLVVVESKKESDGSYTGVRSNYFDLTDQDLDVDYSLDVPLGMLNEIKTK